MELSLVCSGGLGLAKCFVYFFMECFALTLFNLLLPVFFFFFSSVPHSVRKVGWLVCIIKQGLTGFHLLPQKPLYIRCDFWQIDLAGLKLHFEANLFLR